MGIGRTVEIVVVSNGSTDATEEVVRDLMQTISELRVLAIPERGKGAATRAGVLHSRGTAVFLCDADLSMPADEIPGFLEDLCESDVVIGSREVAGASRYDEPAHRHVMGRIFNRLVQTLLLPGIEDSQCGFKAFRRDAANDLFSRQTVTGFGFDAEILYLARKRNYRIRERGIPWHFDRDTRVRSGVDSVRMVGEIVGVRVRDLMGRYGDALPAREPRDA